jgi:hypothetical protein
MKVTKIILGSLSSILFVVALFFTMQNVSYLNSTSSDNHKAGFYQISNVFFIKAASAQTLGTCNGAQCEGVSESGGPLGTKYSGGGCEECCHAATSTYGNQEIVT